MVQMYVLNYYLLKNARIKEKFRVRLHLPYKNYRELVQWARIDLLFDKNARIKEKFCVRFHLLYKNYRELVQWARIDPLFDRWCGEIFNNKKGSPVELLILGAL